MRRDYKQLTKECSQIQAYLKDTAGSVPDTPIKEHCNKGTLQ